MQQIAIIPLPTGYNKKYLLRHLIDVKAATGTKTKKTEQVKEISNRAKLSVRQMYNYIDQHVSSTKQDLTNQQLEDIADYYNMSSDELLTEKYLEKYGTPAN